MVNQQTNTAIRRATTQAWLKMGHKHEKLHSYETQHERNITSPVGGCFPRGLVGSGCNFGANAKQESPPSLQSHFEAHTKQTEAVLTKP